MKLSSKPKIIISRTDNIGDVVLTLPLAKAIKELYPSSEILFLGKSYIKPLIDACENIDGFLSYEDLLLTPLQAEVIIHVFPRRKIARMAFKARIKNRIGTSHRYYHWRYCTQLVNFTRKNSPLHEAQLNVKLAFPLGVQDIPSLDWLGSNYGLTNIPKLDEEWAKLLDPEKFNLIIHPLSRGSSRNWDWKNYKRLIELLPAEEYKIFVTGSAEESAEISSQLSAMKDNLSLIPYSLPLITDLSGKLSFTQLLAFIAKAEGLVAASTGPLHIAAALGKRAIGLYPSIKPMHPGRWAPLGPKASYLALNKDCIDCRKGGICTCINTIKPEQVREQLISN